MKKQNIFSAIGICFKHAPVSTAANITLGVIGGVLPLGMIYIVASFINSALAAAADKSGITHVVTSAALMLAAYLYNQLSQVLQKLAAKDIEMRLRLGLRPLMVRRQAAIDFELTEDGKNLDLITFVTEKTESRLIAILNNATLALRMIIQTAGIMAVLAGSVWWLPLAFVFGSVPLMIIAYRGGTAVVEKDKEVTVLTRMMYYISDVLSGREAAAERTLFGFSAGVNEKFKALHRKRSDINTELIARWDIRVKLCGMSLNVFVLAAMAALASDVVGGALTGGGYIAVVGAMIGMARTLTSSLSRLVFDISGQVGFMKSYSEFWALSADEDVLAYTPGKAVFERLEIRNLWFKYKSGDDYVLKGVDMTIEKGKSYSLIGQNGAGKTTLTKILTGLYRDFEGEVRINGRDIREFGANELRDMFAVIYQDYAKYYVSMKDNIAFGGADGIDELLRTTELSAAAEKLPMGADTPLGKITDGGADVSGGEWQKIAIARAVHRGCPFIILDEPTASLSPMMENKVYHQFAEIAARHTPLLISHRLGSTKISDILFVLDGGRVAETGTHAELMAAGGLYAQMFESQRSWYDEE